MRLVEWLPLSGWENGIDKNYVTWIGKTLGGDGIKINILEMGSVYPPSWH